MIAPHRAGPLSGLRVIDISTVVAGPWAAALLGDMGAQVLKVELPKIGDGLRAIAPHKNGVPLWFKVTNRNKLGITLDLRTPEGRTILGKLLPEYDVLIENYRPGTLDGWGITKDWMQAIQPKLTILRISGFGQTGPYSNRPGFARVLEAMSGFTNICGEPDGPPMHMGFPIADAVTGLFGALGIVSALYHQRNSAVEQGQEIDCSLLESMLRILDFLPIEYDQLGIVRQRNGNQSDYAAPGNTYRTSDGQWVSIAASVQSVYERLCRAIGRQDLIDCPAYATNAARLQNRERLDAEIAAEIGRHDLSCVSRLMAEHGVACSPIYDIEDVFKDDQVKFREAIISIDDPELGAVRMQNVVPKFSATPGMIQCSGPKLGEHNDEIFEKIGLDATERGRLQRRGII